MSAENEEVDPHNWVRKGGDGDVAERDACLDEGKRSPAMLSAHHLVRIDSQSGRRDDESVVDEHQVGQRASRIDKPA